MGRGTAFIRGLIPFIIAFVLICSLLFGSSVAEQFTWDCPECGRTGNTGKFCGSCAHPSPKPEETPEPKEEADYGYETALQYAGRDLSNLNSLREAVSVLKKAGTYAYSKSYLVYLQQILSVQSEDADFDDIILKLELCRKIEPFEKDLAARGFPSCEDLIAYATARKLEEEGNLAQAKSAYESMIMLDALDRAIALTKMTQYLSCTIVWKDDTGKTIDTTVVRYGDLPAHTVPEKEADKQYTYSFIGWEPEITEATEDAEYTALFSKEIRFYTITWKNDAGKTIDTTTVAYGEKPKHAKPEKSSDKKYTYSFSGWEPAVVKVTGDATYKAVFKEEAVPVTAVPVLSEAYPGLNAHLKSAGDDGYRVYSFIGPGKTYAASGGYKPAKQKEITVYFEENGYVLADVQYQTTEERFVYLPVGSFTSTNNIPGVSDLKSYSGTAEADITPTWGPGNRFNSVGSLTVNKGTRLTVFFQENGFVYAEYTCGKGKVRMWLPANKITIKDAAVTLSDSITSAGESNFK